MSILILSAAYAVLLSLMYISAATKAQAAVDLIMGVGATEAVEI